MAEANVNESVNPTIEDVLATICSREDLLKLKKEQLKQIAEYIELQLSLNPTKVQIVDIITSKLFSQEEPVMDNATQLEVLKLQLQLPKNFKQYRCVLR